MVRYLPLVIVLIGKGSTHCTKVLECFQDGGGLWITSSRELDIKGTTFNSTQAQKKGNGGALFLNSVGSVSINESNFIFSSADGSGGGIWLSEGIAQIENCSFNHTTAREGSALAVGGNAEANLIDTNILKSRTFPLKGGVLATLSCAAKVILNRFVSGKLAISHS